MEEKKTAVKMNSATQNIIKYKKNITTYMQEIMILDIGPLNNKTSNACK